MIVKEILKASEIDYWRRSAGYEGNIESKTC